MITQHLTDAFYLSVADAEEMFMAALREQPGDVATLLAQSDWYEEHGLMKQAQILRYLVDPEADPQQFDLLTPWEREQLAPQDPDSEEKL